MYVLFFFGSNCYGSCNCVLNSNTYKLKNYSVCAISFFWHAAIVVCFHPGCSQTWWWPVSRVAMTHLGCRDWCWARPRPVSLDSCQRGAAVPPDSTFFEQEKKGERGDVSSALQFTKGLGEKTSSGKRCPGSQLKSPWPTPRSSKAQSHHSLCSRNDSNLALREEVFWTKCVISTRRSYYSYTHTAGSALMTRRVCLKWTQPLMLPLSNFICPPVLTPHSLPVPVKRHPLCYKVSRLRRTLLQNEQKPSNHKC